MLSSTITHLQKVMQNKIYQLGHLLPVCSSSRLLSSGRLQTILQQIQEHSALPETHFKALYRGALNYFAEFVQVIPDEPQAALGGLFNLGLARAMLALKQYVDEAKNKYDTDPLINYAIFTAGLFFDVGKMISQQKIVICNDKGHYISEWYPFAGSLVELKVDFYKMYPYATTAYQALNHEGAVLLSRQLMPKEGFLWLSSDLEIFIDWLNALRGDFSDTGRRISRSLSFLKYEDILALMKNLPQITVDTILAKESQAEDQFYIWLREGLADGSIPLNTNDANVHVLDDGTIYLHNEIFKRFLESRQLNQDFNKLARDFNERFGIESQASPEKTAYANFLMQRGDKTIQVRNGMLAFASLFIQDTMGIPDSPLKKDIKGGLHPSRQLPGVQQTIIAAERRNESSPSFKMR
jgi:hypothetical protein